MSDSQGVTPRESRQARPSSRGEDSSEIFYQDKRETTMIIEQVGEFKG